jgi:hypothetical protein
MRGARGAARRHFAFVLLAALVAVGIGGASVRVAGASGASPAAGWYDVIWQHRSAVQIAHPGDGGTVSQYQVHVALDGSFDFAHALSNGHDLRVTSEDGKTLIPFWIESWDPSARTASIWVKVPSIPVTGTTIYLYYGNPAATTPAAPAPVPVPPTGPFTKAADNPQPILNAPCGGTTPQLLPENMVESDGTYYLLVTDRSCDAGSAALLSAPNPSGPWSYEKQILTRAMLDAQGDQRDVIDAPHLVKDGSTWYLFYSHYYQWGWNTGSPGVIGLAKSTHGILGPYEKVDSDVLTSDADGSWDGARVWEPYVTQGPDGNWVMVFMGDRDAAGGYTEQVGIATSKDIEGPYEKSTSNPVLAFGPSGSLDAGTVADPWVVKFGDTYYIGYTASPTKAGWNTTYATTTDFSTFTKSNTVILGQGGSYDSTSAFRGAVTQVGDTYYFPYTSQDGSGLHFSMATQPVMVSPPSIIDNPDAVFDFYDGFDGSTLDTSKWDTTTRNSPGGSATVSDGELTLTAPVNGSANVQELVAKRGFGPGGTMLEALARHDTAAGDGKTAGEVGLGSATFDPSLRIADYDSPYFEDNVTNNNSGGDKFPSMSRALDSGQFLLHRIAWAQPGSVDFSLENDTPVTATANIPTQPLTPWLAAVSLGKPATLTVDWIRVRNWVGAEAQATLGTEEASAPEITVPADLTAEATSPAGAPVDYSATATSAIDGSVDPSCTPASGSVFPIGATTVTCTAKDEAGNQATPKSFTVTVNDTTPPAIDVPSPITQEATGSTGAPVSYSAKATDAVGVTNSSCTPASESVFPIGKTTVTCTTSDAAGNTNQASFDVTVQDTTPPAITVPANITDTTSNPAGKAETFPAPTATDLVDGAITPTCTSAPTTGLASGWTFPVGTTTITCTATDQHVNTAAPKSFTVTIALSDTTPPVLTVPANIKASTTSPVGALVNYTVTATDPDDSAAQITIVCTPPSGSTFPFNTNGTAKTTTVTCNAHDRAGNNATPKSFTVTVASVVNDQLVALTGQIDAAKLKNGTAQSLESQLANAGASFATGDKQGAKNSLTQFTKKVNQNVAEIGTQASAWIGTANQITAVIGS